MIDAEDNTSTVSLDRVTVLENSMKGIEAKLDALLNQPAAAPVGMGTHGFKNPETVSDPSVQSALETEAILLKQLINPRIVIYRGRKSCTRVNETQQALETVTKFLQEKWLSGSVRNMR
jgi:hypothetical protein